MPWHSIKKQNKRKTKVLNIKCGIIWSDKCPPSQSIFGLIMKYLTSFERSFFKYGNTQRLILKNILKLTLILQMNKRLVPNSSARMWQLLYWGQWMAVFIYIGLYTDRGTTVVKHLVSILLFPSIFMVSNTQHTTGLNEMYSSNQKLVGR